MNIKQSTGITTVLFSMQSYLLFSVIEYCNLVLIIVFFCMLKNKTIDNIVKC